MRKAAMPVPYIIALIIGVVVVAVLAYWFVSSGSKGANIGNEAECTARKIEFCTTQSAEKWRKMNEVCKGNAFQSKPMTIDKKPVEVNECYEFCTTIIPGWKSTTGELSCQPSKTFTGGGTGEGG